MQNISRAGKDAATKISSAPKGDSSDEAAIKVTQMAAAEVIKKLAEAADTISREAEKASAEFQKVTEEAVKTAKQAADKATEMVHMSINDANEKILEATSEAIRMTVGEEEATFFDMEPLKAQWGSRGG